MEERGADRTGEGNSSCTGKLCIGKAVQVKTLPKAGKSGREAEGIYT